MPSDAPRGWRTVRFDELFSLVNRTIAVDDSMLYATAGVRWYGNGAFVRDRLLGMQIATKQLRVLHSGDVVYNKLFAWKSAFAVAGSEVDQSTVSGEFPTYLMDESLVEPRFLAWYFRHTALARQAGRLSKGAAAISRLRLNPAQFWELTIPLPALPEQTRLATLMGEAATKLDIARAESRLAGGELGILFGHSIDGGLEDVRIDGTLGDILLEKPRNGWSARCDNDEAGVAVLSLSAVRGFTYNETEFKRTSEPTKPNAHYWLRPGDLLVTRSNTLDLVGHAAIYNGSPSPCIYPDLMMRLTPDSRKADPRFVLLWLQSSRIRRRLREVARGTSPSMKKIGQTDLMSLPFPACLSVERQREMADQLERARTVISNATAIQARTAHELEALEGSLLNSLFEGGL